MLLATSLIASSKFKYRTKTVVRSDLPGDGIDRNIESPTQNLSLPHLGNILRADLEVLLSGGASDPVGQDPLLSLVLRHRLLSLSLSLMHCLPLVVLFPRLSVFLGARNETKVISLTACEISIENISTAGRQHFYFANLTMGHNGNITGGFL